MKKVLSLLAPSLLLSNCAPEATPRPAPSPAVVVETKEAVKPIKVNWTAGTLSGEPDLYVNVFGKSQKVGSAQNNEGEVHQNFLKPGDNGVPADAISGFGIDGADGESEVYYAKRNGAGIKVYHRIWNPYPDDGPTGWQGPRLVTTINP